MSRVILDIEDEILDHHNVDDAIEGDGHMLESVEIEAGSILEADEIYRGIVGGSGMLDSSLE